jgi:multisubunit Na+/H+ antiporter MnhE subunit
MTRLYYAARYGLIFLRALVKANVDVARAVLRPRPTFRPGFLAVPLAAESDLEITILANSITLTPGTISIHVDRARRTIVIHALDVGSDPDAVRADVKQTLEANILRFTRRAAAAPKGAR